MIASITWFLFSSRLRIFLSVVTFLVGLYALAGFVIVPWLARPRIVETVKELTGRETRLDTLKLNPFSLSGTMEGFEMTDTDGEKLLSFDRAHANVEVFSLLFRGTYHLSILDLAQPYFRFQINRDGSINIADLINQVTAMANVEPDPDSPPKVLKIDDFKVTDGLISVTDLSRSADFTSVIAPISFDVTDFHTGGESDAPYAFSATSESGEAFSWKGFVAFNPLRSKGAFEISGFSMPKYEPFFDIVLETNIVSGTVAVTGNYDYSSGAEGVMRLEDATIFMENLEIVRGSDHSPVLSVAKGSITAADVDALTRRLEVDAIVFQDGILHAKRLADGQIDLITLVNESVFSPGSVDKETAPSTGPADAETPSPSYHIRSVNLEGFTIELIDEAAPTPAAFALDNARLSAVDIRSEPGEPVTVSLGADARSGGSIAMDGTAITQPVSSVLALRISDLALKPGNPYLAAFADAALTDGRLTVTGQATLNLEGEKPAGGFHGDIELSGIHLVGGDLEQDLVTLTWMGIEGLKAELDPMSVEIGSITLVDPRATILISENGSINLLQALRIGGEETSAAGKESEAEPSPAEPSDTPTGVVPPFPITIGAVNLENAGALVIDRSVSPSVTIGMETLSGTISGLSSEELARADLDLGGTLTGGTRLKVTGQINPLIEDRYSDVAMTFEDFNLTAISPYFGKYAGYALQKGKLSFDLNYKISQADLEGENVVVIDQLTLGSKVESEDAINLPIPLAISLMKDRDGVINIDVPVSGNLNDPEFGFGRVITAAIVNVITKLVTSPFSMLGGLIPGGSDVELSFVSFPAGSIELDDEALKKTEVLAKALNERPTLKVEIVGGAGGPAEANQLKTSQLDDNLRVIRWRELKDAGNKAITLDEVVLTSGDRDRLIVHAFNLTFPGEAVAPGVTSTRASTNAPKPSSPTTKTSGPSTAESAKSDGGGLFGYLGRIFSGESGSSEPEPSEPPLRAPREESVPETGTGGIVASDQTEATPPAGLTITQMESRLLETLQVADEELRKLADARAEAIRSSLETVGGISPDRLFVVAPDDPAALSAQSGDPRVSFNLQ